MGGLLVPLNNDRGALTGIEQGINNYFEAFDRARDKKEQAAKQADQKKMQMKMQGLIQDEGSGEYGFDDETMMKRERENRQAQGNYQSGLLGKGMMQGDDGNVAFTPDEMKNQALRRNLIQSQINRNAREKSEKQKEMSAVQAKQLGLYNSGLLAEQQFKEATANKNNYDPTSSGQWIDNSDWVPNWMKNDNAIRAQSAQDAWIESYLRDASGAAIPPSERGAYKKDFFPMPGDPPDVVKNKEALRAQKMENAKMGSGFIPRGFIPRGLIQQRSAPKSEMDLDNMSDEELEAYLGGG